MNYKIFFKSINFIIIGIIFSFSFVFANSCSNIPQTIQISAGNNLLGNFNLGNKIYFKPSSNFEFTYFFNSSKTSCYKKSDFKMKLTQTGQVITPTSFIESNLSNISFYKISFNFNLQTKISGDFISSFQIGNNNGNFYFILDNAPPQVNIKINNTAKIVKGGTNISIKIVANSVVNLNSISIGQTNFYVNSSKKFSKTLNITLLSSKNITIQVEDVLENKYTKTFSFLVDSKAPEIILNSNNQLFDKVYSISNGNEFIKFSNIVFKDSSFSILGGFKQIYGNFSKINPKFSNVKANCISNIKNEYICSFPNIQITQIDKSKNIQYSIFVEDLLGNSKKYLENTNVFFNSGGPKITNFYLKNSLGVKNIFSSKDNGSKIFLSFTDEVYKNTQISPNIKINLGLIPYPSSLLQNETCTENQDKFNCVFVLGNSVKLYSNVKLKNISFYVKIINGFGKSSFKYLNLTVINQKPIIDNIEINTLNSIKSGVIETGDSIRLNIYFHSNLSNDYFLNHGENFISANFSKITKNPNNFIEGGNCHINPNNSSQIKCEFPSIQVINGFVKSNILLNIEDIAGNKIKILKNITIFAVNGSSPTAFRIEDINKPSGGFKYLNILNPINRNLLSQSQVNGWFTGKFVLINKNTNYTLINYEIKSCEIKNVSNPILLGDFSLYPSPYVIYKTSKDINFAMYLDINKYENFPDMNSFQVSCNMSAQFRNSKIVYAPSIIPFNLKISFYSLPRGNLLNANANKILSMAKNAEIIGNWFDKVYNTYITIKNLCTGFNTVTQTISTFSEVWTMTSLALKGSLYGSAFAAIGDKITYPTQSIIGKLRYYSGYITKACDWVTCQEGTWLTKSIGNFNIIKKINVGGKLCNAGANLLDNSINGGKT